MLFVSSGCSSAGNYKLMSYISYTSIKYFEEVPQPVTIFMDGYGWIRLTLGKVPSLSLERECRDTMCVLLEVATIS